MKMPTRRQPEPAPRAATGAPPAWLHPAGVVRSFGENQLIFAEGDDAGGYFKVATGIVRTCCLLSGGRRHVDAFHVPGDFFGFEAGRQRCLSAEAVCRSAVVSYRSGAAPEHDPRYDEVRYRLLDLAVGNLVRAQKHAVSLSRRTAEERVAAFLMDWAVHSREPGEVVLQMTRQDMADHLGLTIETISRNIRCLERKGLIKLLTPRWIRLTDTARLCELAM